MAIKYTRNFPFQGKKWDFGFTNVPSVYLGLNHSISNSAYLNWTLKYRNASTDEAAFVSNKSTNLKIKFCLVDSPNEYKTEFGFITASVSNNFCIVFIYLCT
jgi:hypothetical protein